MPAGARTDHLGYGKCWKHGGTSPALTIAAAKEAQAHREMQYGAPRIVDPHEAMLEEVYRCAGHVQWLHEKVLSIQDDELIETSAVGKQAHFYIRWYQDERRRLVDAASACVKAGVAERRVRIAEQQGQLLAGAIRAILDQLKLTPAQQRQVPQVVRGVLTSMPIDVQAKETTA